MNKNEATQLGGINLREFKDGTLNATFTSVRSSACFRGELLRRGIEFKDCIAKDGRAIRFTWRNAAY